MCLNLRIFCILKKDATLTIKSAAGSENESVEKNGLPVNDEVCNNEQYEAAKASQKEISTRSISMVSKPFVFEVFVVK